MCMDLLIAIWTPPPNANERPQGDDPCPGYHIQTSITLPAYMQFVSYIICRPDDEITTSATHD